MKKPRRRRQDDEVIITDSTVSVPRMQGEEREEYLARLVAAAPPLNENQKNTIRRAIRELRERWLGPDRRVLVDRRKRQLRIKGPDRRKGERRGA